MPELKDMHTGFKGCARLLIFFGIDHLQTWLSSNVYQGSWSVPYDSRKSAACGKRGKPNLNLDGALLVSLASTKAGGTLDV